MLNNNVSIDEIRQLFLDVCTEEYGPADHSLYIVVKDANEYEVKHNILEKLQQKEFAKMKYLDMVLYVLQAGNDVFINIA